jgi:hypothetical protein
LFATSRQKPKGLQRSKLLKVYSKRGIKKSPSQY